MSTTEQETMTLAEAVAWNDLPAIEKRSILMDANVNADALLGQLHDRNRLARDVINNFARAALASRPPQPVGGASEGAWYVVQRDGYRWKAKDEADAVKCAADYDREFPMYAPHRVEPPVAARGTSDAVVVEFVVSPEVIRDAIGLPQPAEDREAALAAALCDIITHASVITKLDSIAAQSLASTVTIKARAALERHPALTPSRAEASDA